jgi:hypothetical protein
LKSSLYGSRLDTTKPFSDAPLDTTKPFSDAPLSNQHQ